MSAFLTGVLAGYGIAVPVGAIAILIIDTGLRRGLRTALAAAAGAATADLVYASAAVVGGVAIVDLVGPLLEPLQLASGLVLVVIAAIGLWRTARRNETPGEDPAPRPGPTYARFLGLTLINPATVAYFAAVIIGLGIASGMTPAEGVAFVAGAGLASLSWQVVLATGASLVGARLGGRTRTVLSVMGYLVVLGFAALILYR